MATYLPKEMLPMATLLTYPMVRGVSAMLGAVMRFPVAERLRGLVGMMPQRSIILESNNSLYTKFEAYLIRHHLDRFRDCQVAPRRGMVSFALNNALLLGPIHINHGNLRITVSLNTSASDGAEKDKRLRNSNDGFAGTGVRLTSNGSLERLRDFVTLVCERQERENSQLLRIFHNGHKGGKKKEHIPCWEELEVVTNRNLSNTIVDASVREQLVDDVRSFLTAESWYNEKGIPYKRGYLLHGPPGTGKTSLVKALAVEHGLPVFAIDMSTLKNNDELKALIAEIAYLSRGQRYILSLEDIDRADIFQHYHRTSVTMDCFLNVLDGITESYGRLLFLSANDAKPLYKVEALMRPGRVDKSIEVTFVTASQLAAMLEHFYRKSFTIAEVPSGLPPAQVINVLQRWPDAPDTALEQLLKPSSSNANTAIGSKGRGPVRREAQTPLYRKKHSLRAIERRLAKFDTNIQRAKQRVDKSHQKDVKLHQKLSAQVARLEAAKKKRAAKAKSKAKPPTKATAMSCARELAAKAKANRKATARSFARELAGKLA